MKKLFPLISLLLLMSSCTAEIDEQFGSRAGVPGGKTVFQAALEGCTATDSMPGTKVYADENMKVLWNADDRISIFNMTTGNSQYVFTGDDGDTAGGFEEVWEAESGSDVDYVYAAYPYQVDATLGTDGVLTMTFPFMQYYKEHSFGIGANTMVAVTDGTFLAFKNVGGYLSLRFFGDDVSVSRVTIQGNNWERIAGEGMIEMPLGGTPTVTMGSRSSSRVSVVCDPAVKLGADAKHYTDFWFVIPPVTFENGFTITVTDERGYTFTKSTTKPFTVSRNTLDWMSPLKVQTVYPDWGIVGGFNDWGGGSELMMEMTAPHVWVSPAFTVPVNTYGFKIRKDHDWEVNYGGEFQGFGTPFNAVRDGANILQDATEDYTVRVTFDLTDASTPMITIDEVPAWSVIGGFNDWSGDLLMSETSSGIWVSPEFTTTDTYGFKLRFNKSWDLSIGGTFADFGTAINGVYNGGDNLMDGIEAGKTVWVQLDMTDSDNPVITINEVIPPTFWSVIGDFNNWSDDLEMTETSPGIWETEIFQISGGGYGFKIRKDHDWDMSLGGSFVEFGVPFEAIANTGDNIIVGSEGQDYQVVVELDLTDPDNPAITVFGSQINHAWCLIGSFSNWIEDIEMEETASGKWQGTLPAVAAGTEFKLRWDHDWNKNLGYAYDGTYTITSGVAFPLESGGWNLRVKEAGTYEVLLDLTGETPTATVTRR